VLHELPLERRTLHGHFSKDLEPVLVIDPGDSVRFSTPSAWWVLASGEQFGPLEKGLDDGHAIAGPVDVRGARPGGVLAVTTEWVRPAGWGRTSVYGHGLDLDWNLDAERATATTLGRTVEVRPFLGVMGMPPPEPGIHPTRPPRPYGGNIDCAELVAGTTLFLPIPVDGGLFSAGDGHARQGDGEISGSAIESPVEAQVKLELRDDFELEWPVARIEGAWLSFGFDEDLDAAATIAIDGMLDVMIRELGVTRPEAIGLASVVLDLRVTQIVNGVKGVHAVLRDDVFR
jgi:acetamidase/formamidase